MISGKHTTKITIAVISLLVCLCFLGVIFHNNLTGFVKNEGIPVEYQTKLFDTSSPISLNIIMDDSEWNKMLENAMAEEYYNCDVEIDGKVFKNVAIRPKGNTSLSSIANDPETSRYSFKIEFDQYDSNQNCYGLDKLILNNNYADNTNMKEALVYDMFQFIGADAPLYNYAKISVNGEYWGIYLALEAVEESFLLRNYGAGSGELYKPDSMNMGGGKGGNDNQNREQGGMPNNFENMSEEEREQMMSQFRQMRENRQNPQEQQNNAESAPQTVEKTQEADNNTAPQNENNTGRRGFGGGMPGEGGFGGGPGGGSGSNLNYSDDSLDSYSTIWEGAVTDTTTADHKRVVKALKNISDSTDLDKYMDIDNLLKFMAVHIFSVNDDSLSGNMAHNYYLYEHNGQLNMIPWDYNLAFGGMHGGSDAASVINDPIDMPFASTEFFNGLLENEEYCSIYYSYLKKLTEEYIESGRFDEFYNRTRSQIDSLVETDPNSFVTYEEYTTAADTLYDIIKLRGESVLGQVIGTVPSSEEEQRENSENLIDAQDIDLSILGTMHGGGGSDDDFGGQRPERQENEAPQEKMPQDEAVLDEAPQSEISPKQRQPGQMPPQMQPSVNSLDSDTSGSEFMDKYFAPLSALVLLILGFIFVISYKRKSF